MSSAHDATTGRSDERVRDLEVATTEADAPPDQHVRGELVTAWWLLPLYFALIAAAVIQLENWLDRRQRRARREGRRQTLRWLERNRSRW